MMKWVYLFSEVEEVQAKAGGDWENVRALLGGKGANLAEMARIGMPVPPGFTITTEACNAYLEAGNLFPDSMWDEMLSALKAVEHASGKGFGDPARPLLVSCRSGAKFSMPGMMDTVLNIGLNDETIRGMIELTGDKRFVYDAYRRLIQMFGSVVMEIQDSFFEEILVKARRQNQVENDAELPPDILQEIVEEFKSIFYRHAKMEFPQDPFNQLRLATEAVFKSWNGKRGGHDAQWLHRRENHRRRLPDQCPGRRRGGRYPDDA